MNIMIKRIGLIISVILLTACVHHGYGRGYSNYGYNNPGYGGNYGYRNNYPSRPPAYGYRPNYGANRPNNNYYNQNNYYNRPQPPRSGYGYGNNGYQEHHLHDGDRERRWNNHDEHHSNWGR